MTHSLLRLEYFPIKHNIHSLPSSPFDVLPIQDCMSDRCCFVQTQDQMNLERIEYLVLPRQDILFVHMVQYGIIEESYHIR